MRQDVYTSKAQLQAMLDELAHAHDLDSKAHTRIARKKLFKLIGNLAGVLIIAFLFITWLQVEDARSKGEVPTVCGYQIYEVKTGSMVPTIPVKSLILSSRMSHPGTRMHLINRHRTFLIVPRFTSFHPYLICPF